MATAIPTNDAAFTLEELARVTAATVLRARTVGVHGVCTDSRVVQPGNAFVALVGERFDGHLHAAEAAAKGARALIVAHDVEASLGPAVLRVDDTTRALGDLGRAHRRRWSALPHPRPRRLVAITGSAGKTTTRRAIAALTAHLGASVHAAEGNLNNAIGVPMVLFGLAARHDLAVVEIGTSSPGEIAHGASIAEPDVAVLTLVAAAHTEGLGTLDDVAREKGALLAAVPAGGALVVNGDDARALAQASRSASKRLVTYGVGDACDVRLLARVVDGVAGAALRVTLDGRELALRTPLLGIAGAYATLAAIATARALGEVFDGDALTDAFASLAHTSDARLAPLSLSDGTLVIDDSYNANRASVCASLDAAAEIAAARGARFVAVLGEMRELGALAASEHDAVGERVVALRPAALIGVSGDAARVADLARAGGVDAIFVRDAAAAIDEVTRRVRPGDVVLVKGSRGVGLEAVVRALTAKIGTRP